MTRYPRAVLDAIRRAAQADPGREVCGFVLREPGGRLAVRPVPNAADRWALADPARFPGGAREGYVMDPRSLRETLAAAARRGASIAAVYHSHVEGPAALSRRDVDEALAGGEPVLPGAEQLVVSIRGGQVAETRRFVWTAGGYREHPLGAGPAARSARGRGSD